MDVWVTRNDTIKDISAHSKQDMASIESKIRERPFRWFIDENKN